MTSLNLNYLFIVPLSKYSHTGGEGFSISILGRHSSIHWGSCCVTSVQPPKSGSEHWYNTTVKSTDPSWVLPVSPIMVCKGPRSCVTVSCHISPAFFSLKQFFSLSYLSSPWHLWKISINLEFVWCFLLRFSLCHLGQKCTGDAMFLPYCIWRNIMAVCPIHSDIHFYHLVTVAFASFRLCKATILWGSTLRLHKHPVLHSTCTSVSIHWGLLLESVFTVMVARCRFFKFHHSLYMY